MSPSSTTYPEELWTSYSKESRKGLKGGSRRIKIDTLVLLLLHCPHLTALVLRQRWALAFNFEAVQGEEKKKKKKVYSNPSSLLDMCFRANLRKLLISFRIDQNDHESIFSSRDGASNFGFEISDSLFSKIVS